MYGSRSVIIRTPVWELSVQGTGRQGAVQQDTAWTVRVPSKISQGSRSLITRSIRLNPEKRPSVGEIIKDNWVESNEITSASEIVAEKLPKSSSTGDPFDAGDYF